jgi:hypothetical protein
VPCRVIGPGLQPKTRTTRLDSRSIRCSEAAIAVSAASQLSCSGLRRGTQLARRMGADGVHATPHEPRGREWIAGRGRGQRSREDSKLGGGTQRRGGGGTGGPVRPRGQRRRWRGGVRWRVVSGGVTRPGTRREAGAVAELGSLTGVCVQAGECAPVDEGHFNLLRDKGWGLVLQ